MGTRAVTIDRGMVEERLEELELIQEEIDELLTPVESQGGRQTESRWTDVPSATSFSGTYRTCLEQCRAALESAREEAHRLSVELLAAAEAMDDVDEALQGQIEGLAGRLAELPENPTNAVLPGIALGAALGTMMAV